MSMDIKLDTEAAKELVQRAMFEMLTEQSREELVQKALNELLKRPVNPNKRYGDPDLPTPLEMAFSTGLQAIVFQVVREYLEDEKIRESIRQKIVVVLQSMVEDKGTWLYDEIGTAVGRSIKEVLEEKRPSW